MIFLVTTRPDTEEARTVEVSVTDLDEFARLFRGSLDYLQEGQAVQVRRADYLDTKVNEIVSFPQKSLRLIKGGKWRH